MNKKDVIKAVSVKTGFSQKDVTEVVEDMLDIITATLVDGKDVSISGFGKFTVSERNARKGVLILQHLVFLSLRQEVFLRKL